MKKLFMVLLPVLAVGGLVYYFFFRKKTVQPRNTGAVLTTGTASGISQWFPGWNGFTATSLNNASATTTAASSLLNSISNAFGVNDGGNSGGVSVGGSSSGGVNSSGSGAGLPLNSIGNVSDVWDTGFTQNDYGLSALNNYDVENAAGSDLTQQQVNTEIDGADFSSTNF